MLLQGRGGRPDPGGRSPLSDKSCRGMRNTADGRRSPVGKGGLSAGVRATEVDLSRGVEQRGREAPRANDGPMGLSALRSIAGSNLGVAGLLACLLHAPVHLAGVVELHQGGGIPHPAHAFCYVAPCALHLHMVASLVCIASLAFARDVAGCRSVSPVAHGASSDARGRGEIKGRGTWSLLVGLRARGLLAAWRSMPWVLGVAAVCVLVVGFSDSLEYTVGAVLIMYRRFSSYTIGCIMCVHPLHGYIHLHKKIYVDQIVGYISPKIILH